MSPELNNAVPFEKDGVRGFLHRPLDGAGQGLVLTHGAGGNCEAPLLVAVAGAFCSAGMSVLRCDLPFRQKRRSGPPSPGSAAGDRAGLRAAVEALRQVAPAAIYLGGHSYGGRQASMLAAEEPGLAQALLLLSYPLHPPDKPAVLRTAHFPALRTPALFVQGDADPFGSMAELKAAAAMIPAQTRIMTVERAGHDLGRGRVDLPAIVAGLLEFGLNQPGVRAASTLV
jgi:uncharacterized protein